MTTITEHPLATLAGSGFLLTILAAGTAVVLPFMSQDVLFALIVAAIGAIAAFAISCAYYAQEAL